MTGAAGRVLHDDTGAAVVLARPPRRVVSLVPSLTEALAAGAPDVLAGATQWCTHPPELGVARVRGTKNPDRRAIAALEPGLVVANKEENRELDVRRLRAAGIPVWVTVVESVPQALASLERLFTLALDRPAPDWLRSAQDLWDGPPPRPHARVAVPVWRDPWMAVGSATFAGDLLARLGLENVLARDPGRYPRVDPAELDRAGLDLVVLPDEPYPFTASDGPDAFPTTPAALVEGRLLTWYGPSLVTARTALPGRLRAPR
ncbi:helical backbone metal receptor [Streptomonospora arabica]|uniref:Helical backbone metal receptor n=1 Tax=Streptomonospora arabica TaxID=412417 RepID=A0ABV9SDP3_9ACTN